MIAWIRRTQVECEDWLRYFPAVREMLATSYLTRDRLAQPHSAGEVVANLQLIAAAGRMAHRPETLEAVYRALEKRLHQLDFRSIAWQSLVPGSSQPKMRTVAILKPPISPREKGVLYLAFEREWVKLLRYTDLEELAREWTLVLAPSSSPHNLPNYVLPRAFPGLILSQISNPEDRQELPRISNRLYVVPLYAASWGRPEDFTPLPRAERDIDLVMVANFAKFKRHFALFRALRHLPRTWRVHLIGQEQDGRTAETIQTLADWYSVGDRFTVQTDAKHAEVAAAFARSKISLILSRREGSCVAVGESLFANTPVGVLHDAALGSRTFINEQTGRLLSHGNLAGQLLAFHAESDRYSARDWAVANISCMQSSRVLNSYLRTLSLARGDEWTQDIFPMCRRPEPRLVNEADLERIEPARLAFKERWGLEIVTR